jgi:hypothetical protein
VNAVAVAAVVQEIALVDIAIGIDHPALPLTLAVDRAPL